MVAGGSCSLVAEFDSRQLHLSFKPFFSHSKGLRTVMARLRSLIRPCLISPRTKLIGVPTIGLPAVITLKIPPNQQSYAATILIQSTIRYSKLHHLSFKPFFSHSKGLRTVMASYYPHSINELLVTFLRRAAVECFPPAVCRQSLLHMNVHAYMYVCGV